MNLSIIIPVFNVEKYLRRCLESIFSQQNHNVSFEVITINDGSEDGSNIILDEYIKKHENLVVINCSNNGAGSARNRGLEIARGKFIWFIDSDDFIEDYAFCTIETYLNEDIDLISFRYFEYFSDKRKIAKGIFYENEIDFNFFIKNEPCLFLWKNIYRKNIIDLNKLKFIERIKNIEDFHFNISFFHYGQKVYHINKRLYNYCYNSASTSRDKSKKNLIKLAEDTVKVHFALKEDFLKENTSTKNRIVKLLLDKSIMGFFYSLFKFNYNYDELIKYYKLYIDSNFLPTNIKFTNIKFYIFEKFVNMKYLFFAVSYVKKFKI